MNNIIPFPDRRKELRAPDHENRLRDSQHAAERAQESLNAEVISFQRLLRQMIGDVDGERA